jgi:hypothetical protein
MLEIEIHPISIARKQSNRVPIVSLTIVHLLLGKSPRRHWMKINRELAGTSLVEMN